MRVVLVASLNSTGVGTYAQYVAWELDRECAARGWDFRILSPAGGHALSVSLELSSDLASTLMKDPLPEYDLAIHVVLPQCYSPDIVKANDHLLYTTSETSSLSLAQLTGIRKAKHIAVSCKELSDIYGRQIVGGTKISIVPGGVKTWVPQQDISPHETLTVSSVGKIENRKCQKFYPTIIENAFRNSRWGFLYTMGTGDRGPTKFYNSIIEAFWHNPWQPDRIHSDIAAITKQDYTCLGDYRTKYCTIRLNNPVPFEYQIQEKIALTDLGIYWHRGEGWGLSAIESMALGIPTISSPCMGSNAYTMNYLNLLQNQCCSRELSPFYNLLRYACIGPSTSKPTEPADDPGLFNLEDNGLWYGFNPDIAIESLGTLLQYLTPEARKACQIAGKQLEELYSWNKTAKLLLDIGTTP